MVSALSSAIVLFLELGLAVVVLVASVYLLAVLIDWAKDELAWRQVGASWPEAHIEHVEADCQLCQAETEDRDLHPHR